MRKIEAQMNAAIAGRRNWAKDTPVLKLTSTATPLFTYTVTTSLRYPMKVTSDCLHVDGRQSPLNPG